MAFERLIAAAVLALFLTAQSTGPAKGVGDNPVGDAMAILLSKPPLASEARTRLANLLERVCAAYQAPVPHLSPSEYQWLMGEINSPDLARMERALSSIQNAQRDVVQAMELCRSDAQAILTYTRNAPVGSTEIDLSEVDDWTGLALELLEVDLPGAVHRLAQSGVARYTQVQIDQSNTLGTLGRQIIETIVKPRLDIAGLEPTRKARQP
jgi:hypothetical protein